MYGNMSISARGRNPFAHPTHRVEGEIIRGALERFHWNKTKAALTPRHQTHHRAIQARGVGQVGARWSCTRHQAEPAWWGEVCGSDGVARPANVQLPETRAIGQGCLTLQGIETAEGHGLSVGLPNGVKSTNYDFRWTRSPKRRALEGVVRGPELRRTRAPEKPRA